MARRRIRKPTDVLRKTQVGSATSPDRRRLGRLVILSALVIGIAARIVAILVAPQTSYRPDHISNMGWSDYAVEHDPWRIYDLPAGQRLVVRTEDSRTRLLENRVRLNAHACNYPPLSIYLFWIQGTLWHLIDREEVTVQPEPHIVQMTGSDAPVTSRVIDTRASRFANALPAVVFDFFLASGVMILVRELRPGRRRPLAEAIAFAVTLLAPPIVLDSAFWNQADSWITCLLVWCLVLLMRERLVATGVLYGVALMTKPQAILFAPVLLYVFFALRFEPGGTWRRALGLLKSAVVAVVVVAFIAAPFMIADAKSETNPDGMFRWFKRSYLGTMGDERYDRTTLTAFNIWWLDTLAQGSPPADRTAQGAFYGKLQDPDATLLGIRKKLLGGLLLAASIVLTWVLCARKWRWAAPSWAACAFLVLLAAFTLPTSVHERYIYYCLPFLIALAVDGKRWIVPLVMLLMVATCEMTSFRWATIMLLYVPGSGVRGLTGLLASLTVLALLYSYVVLIPRAEPPQS